MELKKDMNLNKKKEASKKKKMVIQKATMAKVIQ